MKIEGSITRLEKTSLKKLKPFGKKFGNVKWIFKFLKWDKDAAR